MMYITIYIYMYMYIIIYIYVYVYVYIYHKISHTCYHLPLYIIIHVTDLEFAQGTPPKKYTL